MTNDFLEFVDKQKRLETTDSSLRQLALKHRYLSLLQSSIRNLSLKGRVVTNI